VNFHIILTWERKLKETKKGNCLDCLHCKVSAKSTEKRRLCFCEMAEKTKNHKEFYWFGKELCNAFESMETPITTSPKASKRPLLKGVGFLAGLSWGRRNYA
jgi:hypothetical protein